MLQIVIEGNTYKELLANLERVNLEYNGETVGMAASSLDYVDGEFRTAPTVVKVEVGKTKSSDTLNDAVNNTLDAAERDDSLDARGIKWDARIHASSKALQKNGTWRKKRGVEPALVKQIEEEQNGAAASTSPAQPVEEKAEEVAAPPQPLSQPSGHTFATFKENLVVIISDLIGQGKITHEYVRQLCDYFGVTEIYEIFDEDEKVQQLFDQFAEGGLIAAVDQ